MIRGRINRLRDIFREMNVDGFFITNPVNVSYMSGFTGDDAYLLITQNKTVLITDFRYTEQAFNEAGAEYEIVRLQNALYQLLKEMLVNNNIRSIALEEDYITYRNYCMIKDTLEGIRLSDQAGTVEKLRQVKDNVELELIKKAVSIGDTAFEHILGYIKSGMTEIQVKNELEYKMKCLGASSASFDTIVASGKRSAMPHGVACEKIIQDGDIVTLDFGCIYKGYCSDMTRTFFVGNHAVREETNELMTIYDIVNDARLKAVLAAKEGITGRQLDTVARDHIAACGYGQYFGHGLGHGVGMMIHEAPNANLRNTEPLPAGAVITVEPGIYIEGLGGVRIEDMIYIEKSGCKILTGTPRDLKVI